MKFGRKYHSYQECEENISDGQRKHTRRERHFAEYPAGGGLLPTEGQIIFHKKHIERMNEDQLADFRQKYVGFVFQSYNLLPTLTALENVTLPLIFKSVPVKERNERAMEMLKAVGQEMSGGQQQRVSIARAFVNRPPVVFADEPTGNLDTRTTYEMMDLITGLAKQNNQTLVIVTHDLELSEYADRIVMLQDGKIEKIEDRTKGKGEGEEGHD